MGAQVEEVPVLVAGAGPAGLAAAAVLGRYGIETLLVERRHRPSELPRATAISTRSMELLRSLGLEHEVRAGGVDVEWLGWSCETLADVEAGAPMPLGLPTREQAALISPTGPACVPQDHLEPVLLRHLAPHTTLGKIFTIGYIVCGIGIFVAAITALAKATLRADQPPPE